MTQHHQHVVRNLNCVMILFIPSPNRQKMTKNLHRVRNVSRTGSTQHKPVFVKCNTNISGSRRNRHTSMAYDIRNYVLLVHRKAIVPGSSFIVRKRCLTVAETLPPLGLLLHRTDPHEWICLPAHLLSRRPPR